MYIFSVAAMSEDNAKAVEQVTQEVKDVKLENGTAPGSANGTPSKNDDSVIPFKVNILNSQKT